MESYGLKCRLSLPPNLLYDEAIKNVSLLEVNRDKKLYTSSTCIQMQTDGWPQHTQKTTWNSINRDKTNNITFQVKGFLIYGPYENLIKKHMWLGDFWKSSTAYQNLRKIKYW